MHERTEASRFSRKQIEEKGWPTFPAKPFWRYAASLARPPGMPVGLLLADYVDMKVAASNTTHLKLRASVSVRWLDSKIED